ncbi:YHS domain-containing (seleno)protein [Spirosoma panaciterrae]|uniref:YHS domain-containing (seleno)protein n=1 Tax=Spirosoma panaciterrae TaxID=496058 RepID=UPI00035F37D1|nr:YHS domain-containing (seleno)protein [Spirosoma panaciterrae]
MKRLILYFAIVFCLPITTALAQKSPVFAPGGKALRGYDPVAYFAEGKPVPGDSAILYAYQGANWYFASTQNRDTFKANPEKYAPQYGGYCAYGTSEGHKAPTEPDAWTIENGKLYFNYNKKVQTLWNKDRPGHIQKANMNWPALKDKD